MERPNSSVVEYTILNIISLLKQTFPGFFFHFDTIILFIHQLTQVQFLILLQSSNFRNVWFSRIVLERYKPKLWEEYGSEQPEWMWGKKATVSKVFLIIRGITVLIKLNQTFLFSDGRVMRKQFLFIKVPCTYENTWSQIQICYRILLPTSLTA